jgi:transposase
MYVEFTERCTLESFMDGHIRAFRYLQGVPAEILYDNMKGLIYSKVKFSPISGSRFFKKSL